MYCAPFFLQCVRVCVRDLNCAALVCAAPISCSCSAVAAAAAASVAVAVAVIVAVAVVVVVVAFRSLIQNFYLELISSLNKPCKKTQNLRTDTIKINKKKSKAKQRRERKQQQQQKQKSKIQ